MKRFMRVMGFLSIALVLAAGLSYGQTPNIGKVPWKAMPNLSFPIIFTDIVATMWQQYPVPVYEDDGITVDHYDWVVYIDPADGKPVPIPVAEGWNHTYSGAFPGNTEETYYYYSLDPVTGCAVDIKSATDLPEATSGTPDGIIDDYDRIAIPMLTFLQTSSSWNDQPVLMVKTDVTNDYLLPDGTTITVTVPAYDDPNLIWNAEYIDTTDIGGNNTWQADWFYTGGVRVDGGVVTEFEPIVEDDYVKVDFIDWGNPLENIYPTVGKRFPVEVTFYKKLASGYDGTLTDNELDLYDPMVLYKMACLEYPSSKSELFGQGTYDYDGTTGGSRTFESAFATVLTTRFFAEIWGPDGSIVKIPVEPGIGPSGKMNFASNNGGWMPTMPGWHRIWLHTNDPLIDLSWTKVNNDEHYIMSTGCEVQDLNENKLEQVGVVGDSTFIDVYVSLPSGNRKKAK